MLTALDLRCTSFGNGLSDTAADAFGGLLRTGGTEGRLRELLAAGGGGTGFFIFLPLGSGFLAFGLAIARGAFDLPGDEAKLAEEFWKDQELNQKDKKRAGVPDSAGFLDEVHNANCACGRFIGAPERAVNEKIAPMGEFFDNPSSASEKCGS